MKKRLLKLFLWVTLIIAVTAMLNIEVSTRQGVNYKVHTIRMPLYLKILDFLDRHYNYGQLVKSIVAGAKTDKERVMKIFEWTYKNIRRAPKDMPLVDDHVWYTIVRGYGVRDQFSDVFTVLCNYAGIDSFYNWVYLKNHAPRMILSFVRINGRWNVFDPYNGVYFKNNKGELADIEEILRGDWLIEKIGISESPDVEYTEYFKNLSLIKDPGFQRANLQSPINRLKYEIRKRLR